MTTEEAWVTDIAELKEQVISIANDVRVIHDALCGKLGNGSPAKGLVSKVDNLAMQTRWQWLAIAAVMLGILGIFLKS